MESNRIVPPGGSRTLFEHVGLFSSFQDGKAIWCIRVANQMRSRAKRKKHIKSICKRAKYTRLSEHPDVDPQMGEQVGKMGLHHLF